MVVGLLAALIEWDIKRVPTRKRAIIPVTDMCFDYKCHLMGEECSLLTIRPCFSV